MNIDLATIYFVNIIMFHMLKGSGGTYDTAYYSRSYVAAVVVVVAGIIRKRCPSHTGISVRGGI